jgi:hypothetical protein
MKVVSNSAHSASLRSGTTSTGSRKHPQPAFKVLVCHGTSQERNMSVCLDVISHQSSTTGSLRFLIAERTGASPSETYSEKM